MASWENPPRTSKPSTASAHEVVSIATVIDQDSVTGEIERFVRAVEHEEAVLDRLLASVPFTDIVESSERAAALGDRSWAELVERHHSTVRAMLGRYRGVEASGGMAVVIGARVGALAAASRCWRRRRSAT